MLPILFVVGNQWHALPALVSSFVVRVGGDATPRSPSTHCHGLGMNGWVREMDTEISKQSETWESKACLELIC